MLGWKLKKNDKNNISIVLVSKGKDPSKHIDLNINVIKYGLAVFIALFFFSASSFFIYFTQNHSLETLFLPSFNEEYAEVVDNDVQNDDVTEEPVLDFDFPIFEFDIHKTAINSSNLDSNTELEEKITDRLIEVEKKLIDMQELLKKKGIKKKLSIGGEYVPVSRLSEDYLDAINNDLDDLSEVFFTYPFGKPTSGKISSFFGYRKDPFHKRKALHTGIDFSAGTGTPVITTADGVVKSAGWRKGYGKCIVVQHKSGYKTLYGHLSKIKVIKGQKVKSGDLIGKVGSTGRSTGPHLHYEVYKDGKRINPKNYLNMG
jgi:murein DD-endopeptidase MepM/ murein hydrolase activator NlpD